MPEEPIPPIDPTPFPEDEWTDESGGYTDEQTVESSEAAKTHENEWDAPSLDWEEDLPAPNPEPPRSMTTQEALAWVRPLGRRSRRVWQRLLVGLRKRIPAAAELSDGILSGILLSILLVLLLSLNSVRHGAVAMEPSPRPVALPAAPRPPAENPAAVPGEPGMAAPEPGSAVPSPVDEADRDRIGQLQAQLTEGFLPSASGVIASVQADFAQNHLAVILTHDWYRLSSQAQTELADQLLARSTGLEFADLQLRSTEGDLLARSPVVGNRMVILQRETPPVVEPPPRPRYRIMVDR